MIPAINPQTIAPDTTISTRSVWRDNIWHLDDPPPGAKVRDFSIVWDFAICDSRFTDHRWATWYAGAKTFLWSLQVDPPPGSVRIRNATMVGVFKRLKVLIRWMAKEGHRGFGDLDRAGSDRFLEYVGRRRTRAGKPIDDRTIFTYRDLLARLDRQGARYPSIATLEPLSGISRGYPPVRSGLPYTPDAIAVPLVSGALRLLGTPANDVIALQALAQSAQDGALAKGMSYDRSRFVVLEAIRPFRFSTLPGEAAPWQDAPVTSTKQVRFLVQRLYEACFVVISYLVGPRVSEILGLQPGCIEHRPAAGGDERFAYLVGRIYKMASSPGGKEHRWPAPPAVERAIAVMETLSEPLRKRSGRPELWLLSSHAGLLGPNALIHLPVTEVIINRLNRFFAPFIGLPDHAGEPWRLTTHQGRKTFARFVGKRDRTGLHALQHHLGHVSRVMTDRSYVGTDFQLNELIDEQAQEETRAALEELLTATRLSGKGGRLIASRSQFRGRTLDGDVRAYVDFLMAETDLRLGVCDWGYCVYRMESSACFGNEKGPNPVLRTQSTCVGCANFAVSAKHRPVWEARRARNAALLEHLALDPVSREMATTRIAECDGILAELDKQMEVIHETN
jgi:integrase